MTASQEFAAQQRHSEQHAQPKAVRPEEVEPGTRFRFAEGHCRSVPGPYKVVDVVNGKAGRDERCWLSGAGRVHIFTDVDRIIPLPDQE